MKKIFSIAIMIAVMAPVSAEVETTIGADVTSSYVWRGMELGGASIQPGLSLGYEGIELDFWGSTGIVNPFDTKEFDITLSYSIAGLSAGVTDYWFNAGPEPYGRYFKYGKETTNHVFEAYLGYDLDFVSVSWFTNFYGNDFKADGSRAFSSYCEIAAPFSLGETEWSAAVGFVPFGTPFYGTEGFAVTNISLSAAKSIAVTESFSVPVSASVTVNPCTEMTYLVLGISF